MGVIEGDSDELLLICILAAGQSEDSVKERFHSVKVTPLNTQCFVLL